jgi:hypothetical protein
MASRRYSRFYLAGAMSIVVVVLSLLVFEMVGKVVLGVLYSRWLC